LDHCTCLRTNLLPHLPRPFHLDEEGLDRTRPK
jgi:hypothetical protein